MSKFEQIVTVPTRTRPGSRASTHTLHVPPAGFLFAYLVGFVSGLRLTLPVQDSPESGLGSTSRPVPTGFPRIFRPERHSTAPRGSHLRPLVTYPTYSFEVSGGRWRPAPS